jgi:hypothetical protein
VRDYWPFWRQSLESASTGKLVFIDQEALSTDLPKGRPWVPIVFDDNIESDDAHIIDVRDAQGREIPFDRVAKRHLIRAEPYLALRFPQTYFLDSLKAALSLAGLKWPNEKD